MGSGAKPQPANDFVHIGVQKVQLCWQQFLLIFLGTDAIFYMKTGVISYGVIPPVSLIASDNDTHKIVGVWKFGEQRAHLMSFSVIICRVVRWT